MEIGIVVFLVLLPEEKGFLMVFLKNMLFGSQWEDDCG
jgi:hypothetical protein